MNTTKPARCPADVIAAAPEVRIAHFQELVIAHEHLKTASETAMDAIKRSTGPRVIIVTGPTGVGKTTLARDIYTKLRRAHKEEMEKDRGFIPVAGLSAVAPNGTGFSWKDFYIRLLTRHGDVLIDRKLMVPNQDEMFPDTPAMSSLERSVADALRRSVESSLRHRRTKVLIIDEAHHILMMKDPTRLEYQFEALKSLTIETNVTIVLVGTYRLLDIREQSGQLVRRSEIVHFPRYDIRKKSDCAAFAALATTFLHQLPLQVPPDLSNEMDYLYTKTGGCVGILKDWMARCLEKAIDARKNTFNRDDTDQFALPNKSLRTIIEEAMAGEQKLEDESFENIQHLLRKGICVLENPMAPTKSKSKSGRPRVGERLPVRDPVGGVRHVAP